MLANLPIEKFLSRPDPIKNNTQHFNRMSEIDSLLEEFCGPEGDSVFPIERAVLDRLCKERASSLYPILHVSFLQYSARKVYEKKEIQLPQFSVYPLFRENRFSLDFRTSIRYISKVSMLNGEIPVPDIFSEHLVKSLELCLMSTPQKNTSNDGYIFEELPSFLFKKYKKLSEPTGILRFESTLHALIPKESRMQIEKARKYFQNDELYLIAETKPEDWNIEKIADDPLVIGTKGKDCYFISPFHSTSLEKYIPKEFTSSS